MTLEEFLAALQASGAIKPGTLTEVDVYHDSDCPKLRRGACTCKPDFKLGSRDLSHSGQVTGQGSIPGGGKTQ